jgi:N-acetylglucosaminyldiphosphoundecaprenol N-acetyl-beta-D-mannosaminyltransferase
MDVSSSLAPPSIPRVRIVAAGVDACAQDQMTQMVLRWAVHRESRYACFCNAHMLIEARDDAGFRAVVNDADLVLPDGRPLVWMLRRLGHRNQQQVRGPDAMRVISGAAAVAGIRVGFYGSVDSVLETIIERAARDFPGLQVVYRYSPPFRPLTDEEDAAVVDAINESSAAVLFVGLGCPKQERWMAEHRGRIRAVMLGVGAAFDLYAGRVKEAPRWVSRSGLEWAYRLGREPRRLLGRNLRTSPRFAWLAFRQLVAGGDNLR